LTPPATTATSTLSLHDALPILAKQRVEAMHFSWPASTAHIASAETYHCPAGLFLARPRNREWPFRTATQDCRCSHASLTPRHHRSEEHTSELQSRFDLVCRLLL